MANAQILKTTSFHEQLRKALKKYHDPIWLGTHSPLATPYFLGITQSLCDTPTKRGDALRRALQQAVKGLWANPPTNRKALQHQVDTQRQKHGNRGAHYHYLLLELRFFRHHFPSQASPQTDIEIQHYLNISKARFFKHLKAAIKALEKILLSQIRPTFRLEHPISPKIVVGREATTRICQQALCQHKTVALTGMSGSGKTTLGMHIAQMWPQEHIFWFTIRPTLNDQLSALLFSLGYFLHRLGASTLWQQLIVANGKVDNFDLVLGLARYDLASLQPTRPLFCFDQINLLQPTQQTPPAIEHAQMVEFIRALQKHLPILLIGEQTSLTAEQYIPVTNLQDTDIANWLNQLSLTATSQEITYLREYTGGNPYLISLCITLYRQVGNWSETVSKLPTTAALSSIFHRIWQYLPDPTQHYLQHLAVFRHSAPSDLLPSPDIRDTLLKNQLIQIDKQGGLHLIPALHQLIYKNTPATKRIALHLQAANIRQTFGEYTAAAYHYGQAQEPALAIQIWYPHRQQEMLAGKGEIALTIFEQIPFTALTDDQKQALSIIRAELYQLKGQATQGLETLNAIQWQDNAELTSQAQLQKGAFLDALGHPHQAQEAYHNGISVTARIIRQLAKFRYESARTHIRQRHIDDAWHEVQLAQYEVTNLQGILHAARGHYPDARLAYQQALALAKDIDYKLGVAKTHRNLGIILGLQGNFDAALTHSQQAITIFEQIGDQLHAQLVRRDITGTYLQMNAYHKAIDLGEEVLYFFQHINDTYMIGNIASDLAEAYFELGRLNQATTFAHYGLQQEEANSRPYLLYTLSRIQYHQQQFKVAAKQLQQVIELAKQNEDKFIESYGYKMLGQVYLAQKQQPQAYNAIQQALNKFKELGIQGEVQKAKKQLLSLSPD